MVKGLALRRWALGLIIEEKLDYGEGLAKEEWLDSDGTLKRLAGSRMLVTASIY